MKILSIDIETYCEQDLTKTGVYRYADDPSFEILMLAWAFDDEPVEIADFRQGDELPDEVLYSLLDPSIMKSAFNANFERTCLARHFNTPMPPEQWICTSVHSLELGLPGGLARVAECLELPQDNQKSKTGKALITFFSKPCRPTKTNGGRTRNLPVNDLDRWNLFLDYCKQDVVTERAVRKKLERFPIPKSEQDLWCIDQRMNDHGVKLDRLFMEKSIELDEAYQDKLFKECQMLTQLQNPNSVSQLKGWIEEQTGAPIPGLAKADVAKLQETTESNKVKRVLGIRAEMSKTSTSKYYAMQRCIMNDDRARGLIQFYGANRTGRWAGRLIQVQNLPQTKFNDLELAKNLIKESQFDAIDLLYGDAPNVLSQLIRTTFIADDRKLFYVADFSAIEARMIAWLARERWRMDVFNSHGKIYEASASQMFNVPLDTIVKGHENYALRAKGKIAELALGYGGSVGALESMGALNQGLSKEELKPLVDTWRKTNPAITNLWWSIDEAAIECVRNGIATRTHGVGFRLEKGLLFIDLPSGRSLAYVRPHLVEGKYGKEQLAYEGMDQTKNKWAVLKTYGPKLVENIIQALSRDCLAYSLKNLEQDGYTTVMHVHDEAIVEHSDENPVATLKHIEEIMGEVPGWALGLPLNADGFYSKFYRKD